MSVRKPSFTSMAVPVHGNRVADFIILHDTEGFGNCEALAAGFRNRGEGFGINFAVEAEGRSGWCGSIAAETWHVKLHNSTCVGIEQMGFADLSREDWLRAVPKTEFIHGHKVVHPARLRQIYKTAWICAWICDQSKGRIKPQAAGSEKTGRRFIHTNGITMHRWVPDNDHYDCGTGYPFDKVLELAKRWLETGGPSWRTRVYIRTGRLAP